MVFKKDITPLHKGGQVIKHKGKGSKQAPMPNRGQINALSNPASNSINDYSKASPMPQGANNPGTTFGPGSGDWPGTGM